MATLTVDSWALKDITLDFADQSIPDVLIANGADANGRGIDLTVTDNGQPVSMSGMNVYLAWRHENGNQDLTQFTEVDAASGHYKVYYPQGMLHEGIVTARISIYVGSTTPITGSRDFRIKVERDPIDEGEAMADESLRSFTKAVVDLNRAASVANAAAEEAENVNASLSGTKLTVTNRSGLSRTVDVKGEKGDPGAQGEQGVQGPKGDKGDKGDAGPAGSITSVKVGAAAAVTSGAVAIPSATAGAEGVVRLGKTANTAAAGDHAHTAADVAFSAGKGAKNGVLPVHIGTMGLGRCASAFLPADCIDVAYSNDGGRTWADYGLSDEAKEKLFAMLGYKGSGYAMLGGPAGAGGEGDRLRVTVVPADGRYAEVTSAYAEVSTMGGGDLLCDVEASTVGAKDTWRAVVSGVELSGWDGPNAFDVSGGTFGGYAGQAGNVWGWRLTFRAKTPVAGKAQRVGDMRLYGQRAWVPRNPTMLHGSLYSHDAAQNAAFPGKVSAQAFEGELPKATASAAGAVKPADGLAVASDGALSVVRADYVTFRGTVSGWEVTKWASGRMEQRRRFSWAANSYAWSQWYALYETSEYKGGAAYAEPFAAAPSAAVGLVDSGGYSVAGFEMAGGTAATCPRVYALRPSGGDAYAIECEVVAVGAAAE